MVVRLDPGMPAIKLWEPNSLGFFLLFFSYLASKDNFLQNAASGNVYLVVTVTTNCTNGTGSPTLVMQTG